MNQINFAILILKGGRVAVKTDLIILSSKFRLLCRSAVLPAYFQFPQTILVLLYECTLQQNRRHLFSTTKKDF
jgi:hypothetical protein